jgi:hypothetical protein
MTAAQLAASRANAQLSTGPRTEEGKRRSSLNAFRHGLTAKSSSKPRKTKPPSKNTATLSAKL